MLVWARGETPFSSIDEVVMRIPEFSYEKIKAWENGEELPSISEAKKLAVLYDVPFACFFYSRVPEKRIKPYTDRRTVNGSTFKDISYELWVEIKRIMANRETAIEVNPDAITMYDKLPVVDSHDSIKIFANKIRGFLNIETPFTYKKEYNNNAFNYYRSKFESKGIMIAQISGVDTEEIRGVSIYYDEMPIIAINNKDWERAKVFTLFHEMAHLIRRSSSLCLINFDDSDEEEKICDHIAAEAILPEKQFKEVVTEINSNLSVWDDWNLIKVADRFGVSTLVVLIRLYKLGIINGAYYNIRYNELSKGFEENSKKSKPQVPIDYHYRYLNKSGYLFPRTVLSAYSNGNISYGEMCMALNVNSMHINNIEQVVMFR